MSGDPTAFNRFSSPTITAVRRDFRLAASEDAVLEEALLYVTSTETLDLFRNQMRSEGAGYSAVAAASLPLPAICCRAPLTLPLVSR